MKPRKPQLRFDLPFGAWLPQIYGLIVVFFLTAWFDAQARSKTGIQAIGLSAWEVASVDKLATEIKSSHNDVEVSCLPFNFKPRAPFVRVNQLIGNVLGDQGFQRSLTLTIYMSFHRDEFHAQPQNKGKKVKYEPIGKGSWAGKIRWSEFKSTNWQEFKKQTQRRKFLREYDRRLTELLAWISSVQPDLDSGRLRVIVCPSLEDECSKADKQAYLNLVQWTRERGIKLPMRRSSLFSNAWRVDGMPLEVHGDPGKLWSSGALADGDWISNDGCDIRVDEDTGACVSDNEDAAAAERPTLNEYLMDLDEVRETLNVTFLLWRAAYNTNDGKTTLQRSRGKLTPLTRNKPIAVESIQTGDQETLAVRTVLAE